ncbi:hypothetical protein ACFVXC_06135 [Streptomyces sp. NPDC058257]|uniref:hypothetical protein n=1 Tax=Streptomyces sp. NPDC058257 TaxID=3346409 RepID=UPI0036E415F8
MAKQGAGPRLSAAKMRGLRAAAADRLGRFPSETGVATTNSLRDAGLAIGRDACGHRVGPGHRHGPISSFITRAGRDVVGAEQPEALTAAGTELERQCVRVLAEAGYTSGFTVVEVESEGVRIELDDAEAGEFDAQVLVMVSELYANGWRPLDEEDAAGLFPIPVVQTGVPGASAGMCRQCHHGLMYDESGQVVVDEYGKYLCLAVANPEAPTHVLWE